jgi:serine acetyltransferase
MEMYGFVKIGNNVAICGGVELGKLRAASRKRKVMADMCMSAITFF